jgi:hypothetical protein
MLLLFGHAARVMSETSLRLIWRDLLRDPPQAGRWLLPYLL